LGYWKNAESVDRKMATARYFVGWAKPPDANASGGVPTIARVADPMVGTSPRAFAHPTACFARIPE
jgi:hypothetical protein